MLLKAYGKINISLDIVGKREDGYHLLKMIMQTIDLYDLIDVNRIENGIELSCDKSYVPNDEKNIAYKAAKLFIDTYNIKDGVSIAINKNIPVAAGLAGGSTDAAAVLKAMRDIFNIDVSDERLMELGLKLGADVPYCILGGTALCEGIGEKITPLKPFKDKILILVKPNFGVSTKEVYKSFDIEKAFKHPETEKLIEAMESGDLQFISDNMKNLLENVTSRKHTILKNIKDSMNRYGALGSMMSGSGPTIFAFFEDMLKAQLCFEYMKEKYDEVYITRTV
ncbi:4-(cytidine 5'-diphospho)-2-C-methyl-D-erythritol kinase [Clostridium sp.]|jgi:4-diphosphocytidyl-2-C-methyl-D-erythritol kinase|uniref:4-(cytidine 5'-diphospho)-2-C-methyl-D-erythritol kinase n=1 Tax=Clostridium sp. TaxID=1506 RepID=UPI0025892873|nr:4-(cytidine 5'-diphospho)-2-C-methyl-D-erythritol kinase [Clostridium sp.]MDF2505247.1 4-diphosphocytidyl-2C-methyl-D-erythritol kinase [Clostridium sp.]